MVSDQELATARSMLQLIAVFLPVVLGLTGWLVRGLRASKQDDPEFRRRQNEKQTLVTIFGLGVVLLLVASAVAWLYTVQSAVELSLSSFIGWGLLLAAFISVLILGYVSLTDRFNWFL